MQSNQGDADIGNIVELFELHEQVFILREWDVYKLYLTKENVHKFFLSWEGEKGKWEMAETMVDSP